MDQGSAIRIPQPGEILDGKYRIEGTLGQGGMAIVLAATHLHLDERVAIKLLLPQWAEEPEFLERFMREGRSAIKIRSEHVVRVLDVGVVDARPYLVMEYLEGSDLDVALAAGGPMPVDGAVDYLLQACEAIAEAHAHGIIHRDLKPANLFLTRRPDGSACVKVLDFGISKMADSARQSHVDRRTTRPSMVMGSPHYMSPEQMQSSADVDERADIWALGAILHELLSGSPPFKGETITALCATILRDPAPPLTMFRADVPPGLESVVLQCLEKDASLRFANVAELAADLAAFGSPAAAVSAERIKRILDGAHAVHHEPTDPWALHAPPSLGNRVHVPNLKDSIAPLPRNRGRVFGYVVGAMALVAVGSGIGYMIVENDRQARAATSRDAIELTSGAVPPPAIPLPASSAPAAPPLAIAPAAPPPAPAPVAAAGPLEGPAAAEIDAKEPARATRPSKRPHRRPSTNRPSAPSASDALPDFPMPAPAYVPSVGADEAPPLPPSAPSATGTPPAPSPDQLFDDRK
jgi:serine/threonine-protein kinase